MRVDAPAVSVVSANPAVNVDGDPGVPGRDGDTPYGAGAAGGNGTAGTDGTAAGSLDVYVDATPSALRVHGQQTRGGQSAAVDLTVPLTSAVPLSACGGQGGQGGRGGDGASGASGAAGANAVGWTPGTDGGPGGNGGDAGAGANGGNGGNGGSVHITVAGADMDLLASLHPGAAGGQPGRAGPNGDAGAGGQGGPGGMSGSYTDNYFHHHHDGGGGMPSMPAPSHHHTPDASHHTPAPSHHHTPDAPPAHHHHHHPPHHGGGGFPTPVPGYPYPGSYPGYPGGYPGYPGSYPGSTYPGYPGSSYPNTHTVPGGSSGPSGNSGSANPATPQPGHAGQDGAVTLRIADGPAAGSYAERYAVALEGLSLTRVGGGRFIEFGDSVQVQVSARNTAAMSTPTETDLVAQAHLDGRELGQGVPLQRGLRQSQATPVAGLRITVPSWPSTAAVLGPRVQAAGTVSLSVQAARTGAVLPEAQVSAPLQASFPVEIADFALAPGSTPMPGLLDLVWTVRNVSDRPVGGKARPVRYALSCAQGLAPEQLRFQRAGGKAQVLIEAWFDTAEEIAPGASVQVKGTLAIRTDAPAYAWADLRASLYLAPQGSDQVQPIQQLFLGVQAPGIAQAA